MKVTILGVGGIGTHLSEWIARYLASIEGEHKVTLVDGDHFEPKNTARQSFDSPGMKAVVVCTTLSRRFPQLTIEPMAEYVTPENVDFVVMDGEIVLLCVDNHQTRKIVSDAMARCRDVTLISGGNDLTDGNVQVHIRRNGVDLTPSLTAHHPEIANPADKAPFQMGCEELAKSGTPQILFTNLMAAVLMANLFYPLTSDETGFLTETATGLSQTCYTEVFFDIHANTAHARKFAVRAPVTPTSPTE